MTKLEEVISEARRMHTDDAATTTASPSPSASTASLGVHGPAAARGGWGWSPQPQAGLSGQPPTRNAFHGQPQQLDIHRAQFKAIVNRIGASGDLEVKPAVLFGNWTDSRGNVVCVYSTDAYSPHLVASLSRPPRPDIKLHIRPMQGGSGWMCGNGVLSFAGDGGNELRWTFRDGTTSTWLRRVDGKVPAGDLTSGQLQAKEEQQQQQHFQQQQQHNQQPQQQQQQQQQQQYCQQPQQQPYFQHQIIQQPQGYMPFANAGNDEGSVVGYVVMPYLVSN